MGPGLGARVLRGRRQACNGNKAAKGQRRLSMNMGEGEGVGVGVGEGEGVGEGVGMG